MLAFSSLLFSIHFCENVLHDIFKLRENDGTIFQEKSINKLNPLTFLMEKSAFCKTRYLINSRTVENFGTKIGKGIYYLTYTQVTKTYLRNTLFFFGFWTF